jgi:hypothetical protein
MKIQTLLYIGLFMLFNPLQNYNTNVAMSLPIEFTNKQNTNTNTNTIKYPIHVACECEDYQLYIDGKIVEPVGVVEGNLESEWNATKIFIPVINTETPKIIGFRGTGGQFSGFMNGFVMDMNNGADYTKYQEWKCMEFPLPAVPVNWYMYDYDDSLWEMAKSYGMNYQNNSYQIFDHERFSIHLNAEWLWTQNNAKTNVFCRKKDKHVLATTAAPRVSASVSHTTHHMPATTAAPRASASVSHTTHHMPATTAAPRASASVSHTTHHMPATTAAPRASASVSHTTHHMPATTNRASEIRNIYNIKNNIKIIITYAENSKNLIDKHIYNILHHLDLSKGEENDLYKIVKVTHRRLHNHYNNIVDYYKKLLERMNEHREHGEHRYDFDFGSEPDNNNDEWNDRFDEGEKGEKGEKEDNGETKEEKELRLKKTSNLIESMIKLNNYIKVIEYKIRFIKGETKYNLLQILFSLRKQYQDDMVQMMKYL